MIVIEFKLKAVELLEQDHKSIHQVAKELGVPENNLYNWRKQLMNLNLMRKS
ncbi:transposase [Legionella rowbothamii]|uniref:transposase n=1 Tax=Legionella rowbothamii TaxID=96229 RepID=UPI001055B748